MAFIKNRQYTPRSLLLGENITMKWPTIKIQTNTGEEKAIAPYIISASRATDIPAFHGRWFIDKLQRGYCQWRNPFNTNQTTLIAFNNCKIIVFWTKNPAPFIQYLDQISSFNKKFYFQYTLNDYTKENLEPKVPPLSQRIETFIRLSEKIAAKISLPTWTGVPTPSASTILNKTA